MVLEPSMTLNFTLNIQKVRTVALAYIKCHILVCGSYWKKENDVPSAAAAAAAPPSGGTARGRVTFPTHNNQNKRGYLSKMMVLSMLYRPRWKVQPLLKVEKDILMGVFCGHLRVNSAATQKTIQGKVKWRWLKVFLIEFYSWLKGKTKAVDFNLIEELDWQVMRNFMGNFHICFLEPGMISQFAACWGNHCI